VLHKLGIASQDVLVVARPPAREALYHRFENELFDELLAYLNSQASLKVLLLPRTDAQRKQYEERKLANVLIPAEVLDGSNLIAAADLVISAGGTMNREAAALGVLAASVFMGKWAAIDEQLVSEGRLRKISTREDIGALPIGKKVSMRPRQSAATRDEVVGLILEN
jgi:predicted glycosyltransferase